MNVKELADKIGLDEDDYRELIELFIETGKADYDLLKSAYAAGDREQVARRAHTISGASGNLGLMNVHEVAKRIEHFASGNDLEAANVDIETLPDLFAEVAKYAQH